MSEMTAGDVALMNGNNAWTNNPFIYLIWLMMMRYWGNNPDYANAATQGALTRAELTDGLNNQTLQRDLTDVRDSVGNVGLIIKDTGANIAEKMCCGFNGVNSAIAQSRFDLGAGLAQNRYDISAAIAQSAFANERGFCATNRNLDSIKFENAQNTCAITTAIREDGEKTRALMVQQQMQDLRDRNAALNNELQSAQLTLAQSEQSKYLLTNLGHYVPYAGCGCACGNGW